MTKKLSLSIVTLLLMVNLLSIPVFATVNMGYYDRESEDNNTIATADTITSERVMQGQFTSTSDNSDYYKTYISSGTNIYVQLSSIPGGCDYDLYLQNSSGTTLSQSNNGADKGEWLEYSISSSGYYYLKVARYSGTSSTYYRLYIQASGQRFNQSFYITDAHSDSWMYCLGRDHTNSIAGLIFLSFGEAEKVNGVYGINDLGGNSVNLSRVKLAVEKYIEGYNANIKHTSNIQIVVGINNKGSGTSYQLSPTSSEYYSHGAAFKNMVDTIQVSGYITAIYAGMDAEMDWNSPLLTRSWIDGYSNTGIYRRLYNFGDHAGRTDDFSGETDPSFNNGWKASDIHYVSYGNACSYCVPEIYSQGNANQWAYQKKWQTIVYSGVMSTNGWGFLLNQDSYNNFYNKLQTEGVGQQLTTKTWIALPPPAQPN